MNELPQPQFFTVYGKLMPPSSGTSTVTIGILEILAISRVSPEDFQELSINVCDMVQLFHKGSRFTIAATRDPAVNVVANL